MTRQKNLIVRGLHGLAPRNRQICAGPEELFAFKESANERLFLTKDLAAVEGAVGPGV